MENNYYENQPQQEEAQAPQQEAVAPAVDMPVAEEPVAETPAADNSIMDTVKKLPLKLIAIAGVAVVAIVVVILLIGAFSNTYKAPLDLTEKLLNAKSVDKVLSLAPESLNGFCESEAKAIVKLLKKTDYYKDNKEDIEEGFEEAIEQIKDEYGSNYKVSYKITEKEKLDKDDCEEYEDQLKALGKQVTNATKEIDSDQIEDMSDEIGLSKSDCKKLIKEVESAGKQIKKAKVTAGYELEITVMIKGSEADEPEELELSINVYKVNGRWILDYVSLVQMVVGSALMGSIPSF